MKEVKSASHIKHQNKYQMDWRFKNQTPNHKNEINMSKKLTDVDGENLSNHKSKKKKSMLSLNTIHILYMQKYKYN